MRGGRRVINLKEGPSLSPPRQLRRSPRSTKSINNINNDYKISKLPNLSTITLTPQQISDITKTPQSIRVLELLEVSVTKYDNQLTDFFSKNNPIVKKYFKLLSDSIKERIAEIKAQRMQEIDYIPVRPQKDIYQLIKSKQSNILLQQLKAQHSAKLHFNKIPSKNNHQTALIISKIKAKSQIIPYNTFHQEYQHLCEKQLLKRQKIYQEGYSCIQQSIQDLIKTSQQIVNSRLYDRQSCKLHSYIKKYDINHYFKQHFTQLNDQKITLSRIENCFEYL